MVGGGGGRGEENALQKTRQDVENKHIGNMLKKYRKKVCACVCACIYIYIYIILCVYIYICIYVYFLIRSHVNSRCFFSRYFFQFFGDSS